MQKAFPRKNSPCVSQPGFFGESIPQFPGKGCLAESLNTDGIRAESRDKSLFPEGFKVESMFESGINGREWQQVPQSAVSRKITVNSR
jgi:hypothetical protein